MCGTKQNKSPLFRTLKCGKNSLFLNTDEEMSVPYVVRGKSFFCQTCTCFRLNYEKETIHKIDLVLNFKISKLFNQIKISR